MPSKDVVEAVGDLHRGLIVETGNVLATTCWETADSLTIFNVYGTILLLELFGQITTDMVGAAQPNFSYTGVTPAIAITDICAVSASIAGLNVGHRVVWPGGTVAGVLLISGNEYLSPGATGVPFILGGVTAAGVNFIGTIQADGSVADATAGAVIFTCAYVPLSPGSYVTAAV